jgi:predicted nucleotidyltransferase
MKTDNIFEAVSEKFGVGKIPCAIIGGVAINFYHYTRNTTDVDFIICHDDLTQAMQALEGLGYRLAHQQDTFAQMETNDPNLVDVDLMFVDKATMDAILATAREVRIRGKNFFIPSLDNLIALKLHSCKASKRRELKDLLDIVMLIQVNKVDVAADGFKELCLKFGNDYLYQKIIEHCQG